VFCHRKPHRHSLDATGGHTVKMIIILFGLSVLMTK
jgi:hypothetical protein